MVYGFVFEATARSGYRVEIIFGKSQCFGDNGVSGIPFDFVDCVGAEDLGTDPRVGRGPLELGLGQILNGPFNHSLHDRVIRVIILRITLTNGSEGPARDRQPTNDSLGIDESNYP